MFGCSDKDAREAIVFLESLGLIERVFKVVEVGEIKMNNVMFLDVFPSKIEEATMGTSPLKIIKTTPKQDTPIPELGDTSPRIGGEAPPKQDTPIPELGEYTYITTENTTEITTEGEAPPIDAANLRLEKEVVESIPIQENTEMPIDIPIDEEEEISLENELKKTVISLILASQIQNEAYLMQYKNRVPDASMDDVKQLAEKVASDTIINIMRAEFLDSPKKVIEHIKKNRKRVGVSARSRMTQYCQSQNKRLSVVNPQIPVTTYPNSIVNSALDERANPDSEKYCPYFDPKSEFYISNKEIRDAQYKEFINQKKWGFFNRE